MLKKLLDVSWTGSYGYDGKRKMLERGIKTDKGIINEIIYDIHTRYNTNQGSFMAEELKVVKYGCLISLKNYKLFPNLFSPLP